MTNDSTLNFEPPPPPPISVPGFFLNKCKKEKKKKGGKMARKVTRKKRLRDGTRKIERACVVMVVIGDSQEKLSKEYLKDGHKEGGEW